MKKAILFSSLLSFLTVSLFAQGTIPASAFNRTADPTKVVKAYFLSEDMEKCFDHDAANDNTCYWDAYDAATLDQGAATVAGAGTWSYGPQPDNDEDGSCTIKALYGKKGLYLLYEVTDNDFVDILDQNHPYGNDGVELYLDPNSPAELYGPNSPFINVSANQLTPQWIQIQVRMGGANPVEDFRITSFDPTMAGQDLSNAYHFHFWNVQTITFADAQIEKNLYIKIVDQSSNVKTQEWGFPWTFLGTNQKQQGDQISFTFGYNDHDNGQTEFTALRWRNFADPYSERTSPAGVQSSVDTWGAIEFAGNLADAVAAAGGTFTACAACPDENPIPDPNMAVHQPLLNLGSANSKVKNVRYFNLHGRQLQIVNNKIQAPANTLIIRRVLFENGTIQTKQFSNIVR
ncbi:MAG: hypothetical protein GF398_14265 [Chitinivibrionales bacterium]|nr:hypothetical protein [Chitinivibrionales bacterium]